MKPMTVEEHFYPTAREVTSLIPKMKDIPEEFKGWHPHETKWGKLFNDWFFLGLNSLELTAKEGVDLEMAKKHIRAIMTSRQPGHEHKEAAVTYLLSQWFEDAVWVPQAEEDK